MTQLDPSTPAGESRSGSRLPGPERRRQLLQAARFAFARGGFHETSMNDVAAVAGVTKPVVYQRFDSKRALYREVLEDIGERLQAEVIQTAARSTTPREQVEAGFSAYIEFVQHDPDGFRLLFSGASREDAEWAEISQRVEQSIAESIADLLAVEGMPIEHRRALAFGVVGMAEGMVRHWQEGSAELEPDDLLRDLTTLAWVGLRGLGPG